LPYRPGEGRSGQYSATSGPQWVIPGPPVSGRPHARAYDGACVVDLNIDSLHLTEQAATEAAESNYQARLQAFGPGAIGDEDVQDE